MDNSQNRKYTTLFTENRPDNYLITTCITLLGAYTILLFAGKPTVTSVRYTLIFSVFSLICALLTLVWFKFRFSLKERLFEGKREQLIEEFSSKLAAYYEDMYKPASLQMEYQRLQNPDVDSPQLKEEMGKRIKKTNKSIIESYVKNLNADMEKSYIEIFDRPLNENLANLKLMIDKISNRTRYFWFVVGVIFFFVSIVISLA